MTPRPGARERGSVSIEIVMLVPVMVMVATFVLQLGVAGWTASQTEKAARQSARAQSLGESPVTAAEGALPGALKIATINASGENVALRVDVPRVSLLPQFTVERSVSMPRTD
jgi:Flp pilus assembly protein TadG